LKRLAISVFIVCLMTVVLPSISTAETWINPLGTTITDYTGSVGGFNNLTNHGTITDTLAGNENAGTSSSGGNNDLTNAGTVDVDLIGTENSGSGASGGSNVISNQDTVERHIIGSSNTGSGSSGGNNTITNTDYVDNDLVGSSNQGSGANGGSNTINNSSWVYSEIFGSDNDGSNSSGGNNTITSTGRSGFIIGSANYGEDSNGGGNIITNSGPVDNTIYGSKNVGTDSSGGSNTIVNYGTVSKIIYGSHNDGDYSSGGSNTIYNGVAGKVSNIYGSNNEGYFSSGGSNTITNSGTVNDHIYGSYNSGNSSSGGSNTIINTNTVSGYIYGSYNDGDFSSGGSNTIINTNTVSGYIYGSYNDGDDSSGGSNWIYNSSKADFIYGSYNRVTSTSGGSNTITNSGVSNTLMGSLNLRKYTSGGSNTIYNYGKADNIYGSFNIGDSSSGGSNTIIHSGNAYYVWGSYNYGKFSSGGSNWIYNYGTLTRIYGSNNTGPSSSGGSNTIYNYGTLTGIYGSHNSGDDSSGGSNTIYNYGTVAEIHGSYNLRDYSSGGSNTIYNYGTATRIYGSDNLGGSSKSTGNSIFNYGTVTQHIYGSYNFGAGSYGGNDTIINYGNVGGNIYGLDGNDTIIIVGGSSLGGFANGGGGTDTLGFINMGQLYSTGIGTTYKNFENLGIYGGTTTLMGTWNFPTWNTTVYAGTLNVNGLLNTDTFNIYSGAFANIYGTVTANTTNNSGTLIVDGLLQSLLNNYGFLGGTGTIRGDVHNWATISPGNSIGTLTIDGDYYHYSGATYVAEISRNGRSDLLYITGRAYLNGGTVRTHLPRKLYTDGFDWTILKADGGVSGRFSNISGQPNSATLRLGLSYSANTVSLVVHRTPYETFGLTDNAAAIGASLDTIVPLAVGTGSGMESFLTSIDFGYSATQIQTALDNLSPEMYTAFPAAARQNSIRFTDSIRRRTAQLSETEKLGLDADSTAIGEQIAANVTGGSSIKPLWQVWGRVFGGQTDQGAGDQFKEYSLSSSGVVIGSDRLVCPNTRIGLALSANQTDLDFDANASGSQDSILTGIYTETKIGNFSADLSLTYGWHDNDADREIDNHTFSYMTSPAFDSTSWQFHIGGDYLIDASGWFFGPTVGADYVSVSTDGFAETSGSPVDMTIEDQSEDHLISRLGIKATGQFFVGATSIVPRVELGWLHNFSDEENELSAWFTDYTSTPFTINGASAPSDLLAIEADVTAQIGKQIAAFLEVAANFGDDFSDYLISLGFEWEF